MVPDLFGPCFADQGCVPGETVVGQQRDFHVRTHRHDISYVTHPIHMVFRFKISSQASEEYFLVVRDPHHHRRKDLFEV